jgi:hypothetical protein
MIELRNPAIATELEKAVARRTYADLFTLLRRFSGLPGPHPNEKLGWAVAHAVAAYGSRAEGLVAELCAVGRGRVPEKGTAEFLPIVGAFCQAARFASGADAESVLSGLRTLSEDPRHLVREGVVAALDEMSHAAGKELVELLGAWTDGYLSASVALDAMTKRSWLDGLKSPEPLLARLDEVFSLAESAPRADQRSQGYRTLLKTLPEGLARLMDRFPDATVAWLESRAGIEHVELREAFADVALRLRAHGHAAGKLEQFGRLFAASAPPRRDPRTYVGPTRKRGTRRR